MSMFEITLDEAYKRVVHAMSVGLVPLLKSAPGLGKSSLARQIAKDYNLFLIDLRFTQLQDVDFMGIPFRDGDKAIFLPFSTLFPLRGMEIPKGYSGWLLFMDELTSMSKSVEPAAYKLILDRMVGEHHLHDAVVMMAAGNRETDKAVARKLGTALSSRVIHYTIRADSKQFNVYGVKEGFDHRVLGFLSWKKDLLHKFDPDHTDDTFACPRTWEFVSKLISGVALEDLSLPELAGAVGQGAAVEFHEYIQVYANLPKFTEIVAYPKRTVVPADQSTRYAVTSMVLSNTNKTNFEDVVPYMSRLSPEFQVLFFRGVGTKYPDFKRQKPFLAATKDLTEFLYDEQPAKAA